MERPCVSTKTGWRENTGPRNANSFSQLYTSQLDELKGSTVSVLGQEINGKTGAPGGVASRGWKLNPSVCTTKSFEKN